MDIGCSNDEYNSGETPLDVEHHQLLDTVSN